jgi:hypothetical protein
MTIESITIHHIECKKRSLFLKRLNKAIEPKVKLFDSRITNKIETKQVEYSESAALSGYMYLQWRVRR